MNKKGIALFIILTLLMGLLSACGNGNANQTTQTNSPASEAVDTESAKSTESTEPAVSTSAPTPKNGKNFRVGTINLAIVDTPTSRARALANEVAFAAAGMEQVQFTLTEYTDEAFMNGYESLCKDGVDAVVCFTLSETVLPLLKDMFEEYEVKFFLANRKISDESLQDLMLSSPMCLGNNHCEETEIAYELTQYLYVNHDVKNLAVIGLVSGDVNGDYRDTGIKQACEDFGINLLAETRGIVTTEDITNSVEGFIASYPEMDGIFIVGGSVTHGALPGIYQALSNHNLLGKVSIAMVDIAGGMEEYMDDGSLKIVAGGNLIPDFIFAFVAIANELMGTPLSGEAYILNTQMFYITTGAEAEEYAKYIEGSISSFIEEEYQAMMFKWLNNDVTLESIREIINNFSIEDVKNRHADLF